MEPIRRLRRQLRAYRCAPSSFAKGALAKRSVTGRARVAGAAADSMVTGSRFNGLRILTGLFACDFEVVHEGLETLHSFQFIFDCRDLSELTCPLCFIPNNP